MVRMLFGDAATGNLRPVLVLLALGFASMAAPRVTRGLDGWIRHLPARGVDHRRAAVLAVASSQSSLLAALSVLAWIAFHGWTALAVDVLGLVVCAVAAALAVMPVRRRALAGGLALAAAWLAVSGVTWRLALGTIVLGVADAVAGPLGTSRGHAAGRVPATRPSRPPSARAGPSLRIAWRAVGGARLVTTFAVGLLPLAALTLFRANNALTDDQLHLAARFGSGLSVVVLVSGLAELLAVRRPAWPWARSLPWSARQRVLSDAALLGAPALAVLLFAARVDAGSALVMLALVPAVAAQGAAAMRRAPERRTGASGEVLLAGGLLAGAVAVQPWLALATPVVTAVVLRAATARERAQKVSRWLELHHLAAGDPLSWSA
jgi:hypothetical protein